MGASKRVIDDKGRECSKCGVYKPWDEYHKGVGRNGKNTRCKECARADALKGFYAKHEHNLEVNAKYRAENREAINKRTSEYKKAHPEDNRRNARADYHRNAEARKAAAKAWCQANPEKVAAGMRRKKDKKPERYKEIQRGANKRFRDKHPEKVAEREQKRRASKRQAMPVWANRTEILSIFKMARAIRDASGLKYHVDHVVPLQHELVCGLHVTANLRIVCASDNLQKHNKFDPDTFDPNDVPAIQWADMKDASLDDLREKVTGLIERATSNQTAITA